MMSVVKVTYRFNAIPFKSLAEYFYMFVCVCDLTLILQTYKEIQKVSNKTKLKRTNLDFHYQT